MGGLAQLIKLVRNLMSVHSAAVRSLSLPKSCVLRKHHAAYVAGLNAAISKSTTDGKLDELNAEVLR